MLKKTLEGSKTFADFVAYLKANNFRFAGDEAVRAAEQLPLASVDQFAQDEGRPGDLQRSSRAARR